MSAMGRFLPVAIVGGFSAWQHFMLGRVGASSRLTEG